MNKKTILNTTLMLVAGAGMASATTFSDVPASHWGYQAWGNPSLFLVF